MVSRLEHRDWYAERDKYLAEVRAARLAPPEPPDISTREYRAFMVACAGIGVMLLGIIALLLAALPSGIALALSTTNREKQN